MDQEKRRAFYQNPFPGFDKFDFDWFEKGSIPQSLQFMIDCLPRIRALIKDWPAHRTMRVVDVGSASGAGAWLLAVLHRGRLFGPRMKVDAFDVREAYKPYADEFFPDINYIVDDLFQFEPTRTWDLVICSHTIEHFKDPTAFILELQRRAREWVVLYAPFEEELRSSAHLCSITQEFVESFKPLCIDVMISPGWRRSRTVLFVLEGEAPSNPLEWPDEILREHLVENQDTQALRGHSEELWRKGAFVDAVRFLEPIVAGGPNRPIGHYCLAYSYQRCGDFEAALRHYDGALQAGFDEFWVRYHRGEIFAALGQKDQARAELARASELKPDHSGPRLYLKRLGGM